MSLRDGGGADHLLLADMGCRNTLFNAAAQSGTHAAQRLAGAGYGCLRVELVAEPPELVGPLLQGYQSLLSGTRSATELWRWLGGACTGGVSEGSLAVRGERAAAELRPSARRS